MKKLLLITLAALSVSVAQAAAVSWSGTGSISLTNVDYTKQVNLVYTVTLTSEAKYLQEQQIASVTFGSGNTLITSTVNDYQLTTTFGESSVFIGLTETTTYTFEYVLDFANLNVTENITFGSNSFPADLSEHIITPADSTLVASTTALDATYMEAISLSITYTSTVPEPTVLALLALGVAGLALKRRV